MKSICLYDIFFGLNDSSLKFNHCQCDIFEKKIAASICLGHVESTLGNGVRVLIKDSSPDIWLPFASTF